MGRMLLASSLLAATLLVSAGGAQADDWFGWGNSEKGSGDLTTELRQVEPFERIKLMGSMDVFVVIGDNTEVSVSIDDNLQDNIFIENRGRRTLEIRTEDVGRTHKKSRIDITVPSLVSVLIEGSGDFEVTGLESGDFEIEIDGSGDVEVVGTVDNLVVDIDGSGDVDTRDLIAKRVDVSINGSGDVSVYASEEFDGTVNGSGDITVYGDPGQFRRHVGGSGDITRK